MNKVINRLFIGLFSVLLLFIGCVKEDLRPPEDRIVGEPVVTTADVTDIAASTAKCGGEVVMEKGWELSARGVCWSTSPNPTIGDNHTVDGEGKGSFESDISGLTESTTYYIRAYATNEYGTGYGEEKSFTTSAKTLPQITTANVTSITTNTAVCGGNVTSDGNATITARGVCWSTSPNPTINNSKTINGSGIGSFTSNITELTENTTYYVRAYATNSKGTAYGDEKSFTTLPGINGYDWVDLGLPSGIKWAVCNVGATTPEGYGNYYAWGEITTKTSYNQSNSVTYGQQMSDISGNATYDAARANWGGTWRIPTKAEMEELLNNCTWTWTTQNGVNGYRVIGSNGNSIFLPAAGNYVESSRYNEGSLLYWTSTPSDNTTSSHILVYSEINHYYYCSSMVRYTGLSVRPVSD